ncbi:Variant-specific surface protein [Giardia duodenalis]|uniref:Variant-specific surface protein n=1 Tax=Giardia intestinalis TaxID=5741 RepID=V6U2U8_GIAIN|nr:Variant-specific surface protein [Giardia intestinalis]
MREVRAERAGAREARNPRAACTPGSGAGHCKVCEATIGADKYCSECDQTTEAPIDGNCVTISGGDICTKNSAKGTCDSCGTGYFLHKGGCYSTAEDKPGRTLCTAAGDGVCTQGAEGYFAVPGAVKTGESVVACNDATTGVQVNGGATYKGVQNCATCNAPQSAASGEKKAICTACLEGFFGTNLGADGATCTACNDQANCATCSDGAANHCTKCKTGKYLTTTGTCEATCTADTHFSTETAESGKKCFACGDTTNGVIGCEKCTAPGDGKAKPTCTKCTDPKYLKTVSGVTTCETDCGEGYFKNDNGGSDSQTKVCVSCGDATNGVPNCAKCTLPSGATKPTCSECDSGYTLDSQANTCASTGANKSILSTGAIAEISVAAVVVVGGLVGFLCWWYTPRGATRNVISLHSTVDQ